MSKAAATSEASSKQSSAKASSPRAAGAKQAGLEDTDAAQTEDDKSEFVEVTAEDGDHVEPPPPEILEPDPD